MAKKLCVLFLLGLAGCATWTALDATLSRDSANLALDIYEDPALPDGGSSIRAKARGIFCVSSKQLLNHDAGAPDAGGVIQCQR